MQASGSLQPLCALSPAEAGPVADRPEAWEDMDNREYWDDVNGGLLDPRLTQQARETELEWITQEKVYTYHPRAEAEAEGQVPIPLLWVDTNKGGQTNPVIRSRLCVRERTRGRRATHESLSPEQIFSAMPPSRH